MMERGHATAIMEDRTIIQMNIAHYRALLKRDLAAEIRSTVNQLLDDAKGALVLAKPRG